MKQILLSLLLLAGILTQSNAEDPVGTMYKYGGSYKKLHYDPQAQRMFVATYNGLLHIYDQTLSSLDSTLDLNSSIDTMDSDGNYLYTGSSDGTFRIIDYTTPTSPKIIASLKFNDNITSIVARPDTVYLSADNDGFHTIDITTISNPQRKGSYTTNISADDMQIYTNYAYVIDDRNESMKVLDISNISNPTFVTSLSLTGARKIEIDNSTAYVISSQNLYIVSLTNPILPSISGSISYISTSASCLDVDSSNQVLVGDDAGVTLVDVSNPTSAQILGRIKTKFTTEILMTNTFNYILTDGAIKTIDLYNLTQSIQSTGNYDTNGSANQVFVDGNYTYVADGTEGLKVIHTQYPATPTFVSHYPTNNALSGVKVYQNHAYLFDSTKTIEIVDVSNKSIPPVKVAEVNLTTQAKEIVFQGSYAFVTDESSGIKAIDISNPSAPKIVGSYNINLTAEYITLSNNYLYVSNASDTITILNVADPSNISKAGNYTLANKSFYKMTTDSYGNLVVLSTINANGAISGDITILDIEANPANPSLISSFSNPNMSQQLVSLKIVNNYLYVLDVQNQLFIVDIFNTQSPYLHTQTTLTNTGFTFGLDIKDNYAYITNTLSGLHTFTIPRPTTNTKIQELFTGLTNLIIYGNYAFANDGSLLKVLDISDPSKLSIVKEVETNKIIYSFDLASDHLFLVHDNSIEVYDISTPTTPSYITSVKDTNISNKFSSISIQGNYAYVSTTQGFTTLDITSPLYTHIVDTYISSVDLFAPSIADNNLFFFDTSQNIQIFDIFTPDAPTFKATLTGLFASITFDSNIYFYTLEAFGTSSTLRAYLRSTPTTSLYTDTSFPYSTIYQSNNYLYGFNDNVDTNRTFTRYSLLNPLSPQVLQKTQIPYNNVDILASQGHYLYLTESFYGGLHILKVTMQDTDGDGIPDVDDLDDDGDGVLDINDAFPLDGGEWLDTDGDGTGNNADTDDDNDGISDTDEIFYKLNPLDASDATQDADGDGISNIDEIKAGTDPQVPNLTPIEQFVTRFYQVILGRSPDTAGLNDWTAKLKSLAKSGADIAKGFIFSTEYNINAKTDTEYLNTLYSAFFNRTPDSAGFNSWIALIQQGTSRSEVLDGFLNSQEFNNLAQSYGIIANATPVELFVSRFYTQTLQRNPDAAGLADWANRLNTGASSGSDVAYGFIYSTEFIQRNLNNTDYLNVLYRAFFAREADSAGFNYWITQLNAGVDRKNVLEGFLGAPEFATLAGEYGIRVK